MTSQERKEATLEAIAARLDLLMAERALRHTDVFLRSQGGITAATVGNVLRAHDHRISTLIEFAHALDCRVEIKIINHSD